MYNTFIINGETYKIKQLTTDEQAELLKIDFEEVANNEEKFLSLVKKYIVNKSFVFNFQELEEERIDIVKAIIYESDINNNGDFDIIKTFDKMNEEVCNFVFLLQKFLIKFGYNYKELKKFTQQELVEVCIYEITLRGLKDEMIYFLKESNKFFNNTQINDLINELEKMKDNKPQSTPDVDDVVKKGLSGLMSLK